MAVFPIKLAGGMNALLTVALVVSVAVANESGKPKPPTDPMGDPPPKGTIVRLGSQHFRHAELPGPSQKCKGEENG